MTDDVESVVDVLNEPGIASETKAMYDLEKGVVGHEELTYEDWVKPLKLSGGRIALKETVPFPRSEAVYYYHIEDGDDLVCRLYGQPIARLEEAVTWLRHANPEGLEPVLASETPSGGPDP